MLLAFDTTDRAIHVAWENENGRQTRSVTQGKATEVLLPLIASAEQEAGTRPEKLAVVIGPGSFTGIRVGISVAQGLSASLGIPAYGYTGFQLAAPFINEGTLALSANRHGAVCGEISEGKVAGEPRLIPLDELKTYPNLSSLKPIADLDARVIEVNLANTCLDLLASEQHPPVPLEPCYVRPADAIAGKTLISKLLQS